MKICMAVLSLIGVTGIYLRQVKQTGVLGLVGYVVFGAGYLLILSIQVVAVFVLPPLPASQPGYVNDVLAVATGGAPVGDIGATAAFIQFGGLAYIVGGLIFGVALFRAGILARWAAALLAVGAVATLAILLLPQVTPTAVRHPGRRRPGRPRLLPVARAAHPGRPARAQPGSSQLDPAGAK